MDARVTAVVGMMPHLMAERLSMADLSKRVNISPSRLRQLFKMETGQSPTQYLKNLRMQHAEELLKGSFLSIKEITFLTGMKDVSHFVREFKRRYGATPSEFRSGMQR